jgi:hypothetical protein
MPRSLVVTITATLFLTACATATSSAPAASGSGDTASLAPSSSASAASGSAAPSEQPPSAAASPFGSLVTGIRADVLDTDCEQVQGDLPAGLMEVVVCSIGSELVDEVTFARYASLGDLMTFYESRLAEYGIQLATDLPPPGELPEDCWRGHPSESFYAPAGEGQLTNREGCFIDEAGKANQLHVWARPLVLITVEGNTDDIASLKEWSWYDAEGEEPALGGPGIWQPPAE